MTNHWDSKKKLIELENTIFRGGGVPNISQGGVPEYQPGGSPNISPVEKRGGPRISAQYQSRGSILWNTPISIINNGLYQ